MKLKKTDDIVISVFARPADARAAIAELRDADHDASNIGVLSQQDDDAEYKSFKELEGNQAGAGAAVGAATGIAGGAAWALGIAAGVLPAIGPVVAGGLLGAVLASGASGGVAGAAAGALVGLGVSDEDAAYYEEELRQGRTIVVVQGSELGRAFRILDKHAVKRSKSTYTDSAGTTAHV